jgi:GNAT superfamily N-acetyltransferase
MIIEILLKQRLRSSYDLLSKSQMEVIIMLRPTQPFTIRKASLSDTVKIKNLHVASIQEVCAADYSSEQIEAWSSKKNAAGYRRAMTVGGESMFVAEIGNRVAGFVSIRHDELHALYIHPKYIKKGIGLALLTYGEKQLKKSGIKQARLGSTITAEKFYLNHGWKTSDGPTSVSIGDITIPCISMTKQL